MTNKLIHFGEVIVKSRQRKSVSEAKVNDLALSIQKNGLFNPPLLTSRNELVAGEHRLRAVASLHSQGIPVFYDGQQLPSGMIPYVLLSDTSIPGQKEAELHENIKRVQLTWQEEAEAIAELHALRQEQNATQGTKQTFAATAQEIMGGFAKLADNTRVSEAVTISKYMEDPEVRGADNQTQALRIIERKERAKLREEQEAVLGVRTFDSIQLIETDVFRYLETNPTFPQTILISDPPYGIGADTFGSQFAADHLYEDTPLYGDKCLQALIHVLAHMPNGQAAFIFCDVANFESYTNLIRDSLGSWSVWPSPLIWHKTPQGALPIPDKGPRLSYEAIIYLYRPQVRWQKTGCSDIITVPGVMKPEFGAQKPVELYKFLLEAVSGPMDSVLDLFAGTCPSAIAARDLRLPITCVEFSGDKLRYARERLA